MLVTQGISFYTYRLTFELNISQSNFDQGCDNLSVAAVLRCPVALVAYGQRNYDSLGHYPGCGVLLTAWSVRGIRVGSRSLTTRGDAKARAFTPARS
jgi:hypothetical protein